jgi:type I restriction enzyme, R subunit
VADVTDPNIVHHTMAKLDAFGIYLELEVDGLVNDFLAHKGNNALTKWEIGLHHHRE